MVDRIHAGHNGEQDLRGADVRGGLLAADVLLAGLQGEPVGRLALGIDRDADQAARHRTLVGIAAGHEGCMRAAETERHAEALAVADDDVRTPGTGRADQGQREQVGGDRDQRAARVDGIGQFGVVVDLAEGVGVLQEDAEAVDAGRLGIVADMQFDAEAVGARTHDFEGLRVHRAGDEEHVRLRFRRALGQGHRLGRGGRLIEQRGVGDLHAGQVGDHGLEVDQGLHAALRDFRLVRRVGRVPGRVLEDVAQDDVRRMRAVVALADEAAEDAVAIGDAADAGQRLDFGDGVRQVQRERRLDLARHDGIGHRVERVVADDAEHVRDLGVVGADVAFDEGGMVFEVAQGRRGRMGHGGCVRSSRAKPHAGRPSVLLPESLEAEPRFLPLRRRFEPDSPELSARGGIGA